MHPIQGAASESHTFRWGMMGVSDGAVSYSEAKHVA